MAAAASAVSRVAMASMMVWCSWLDAAMALPEGLTTRPLVLTALAEKPHFPDEPVVHFLQAPVVCRLDQRGVETGVQLLKPRRVILSAGCFHPIHERAQARQTFVGNVLHDEFAGQPHQPGTQVV